MKENSTRRYVFYRLQFFFYLALVLCTVGGVFFIHLKVPNPDIKVPLVLFFVVMSLLIICVQLVLQGAIRTLLPLQSIMRTLGKNWSDDKNLFKQVQSDVAKLKTMTEKSSLLPYGISELTVILNKTLESLETTFAKEALETTLITMGNMCSQVAHDMRGPLQSIRVFLENAPAYNDEKLDRFKQIALQSVMRLLQMADELLELRRAREIQRTDFDFAGLIKTICLEMIPQAQSQNVIVEYKGPDSLLFNGDANKLGRVLQNLAQNSLQAMTENSLSGNIRFCMNQQEDCLTLDIEDMGPGIPAENREKLFVKSFTTKGNKGSGLGLMYCGEVVKLHGGEISVHNIQPHGTMFRIRLPAMTWQ